MSTQQLTTQTNKSPIAANQRGVNLASMEEMWRFCTAVVNSGEFKDINTPEKALIRLQAGMELGLSPVWSLTNIFLCNGRPSVFGDGLLGIVLNHKDCEDVSETMRGEGDALTAVCEVKRKGRMPVVREFSVADAKKANLWGKSGPWSSFPKRMLAMRARSWACRDAFADALRGLGVREEVEDYKPAVVREVRTVQLPEEPAEVESFKLEDKE